MVGEKSRHMRGGAVLGPREKVIAGPSLCVHGELQELRVRELGELGCLAQSTAGS